MAPMQYLVEQLDEAADVIFEVAENHVTLPKLKVYYTQHMDFLMRLMDCAHYFVHHPEGYASVRSYAARLLVLSCQVGDREYQGRRSWRADRQFIDNQLESLISLSSQCEHVTNCLVITLIFEHSPFITIEMEKEGKGPLIVGGGVCDVAYVLQRLESTHILIKGGYRLIRPQTVDGPVHWDTFVHSFLPLLRSSSILVFIPFAPSRSIPSSLTLYFVPRAAGNQVDNEPLSQNFNGLLDLTLLLNSVIAQNLPTATTNDP
ncbi:hypothetical protein EST38_g774 [Candolleomyces aberdarensis]|uniref:Uncharacterized protein n=1 Tax=Candolleomyces aberdarensis TaxID=2316362 RepID=A0A4Q2DZ95_9AGAR|nr:hypothetical protein EST38_g774 [Candolleomyces aberdarensis]